MLSLLQCEFRPVFMRFEALFLYDRSKQNSFIFHILQCPQNFIVINIHVTACHILYSESR